MSISIYNIDQSVSIDLLDRAKVYVHNGSVVELEKFGDRDYNCIVKGTNDYSVNVVLDKDNNLFTHQCNCPYSAGPICKHKISLILILKEKLLNNELIPKGDLSLIDEKLQSYDRDMLHQLVMNISMADHKIKKNIMKQLDIKS